MQRGRDHGLAPYIQYRHACGVDPPQTQILEFDQLSNNISPENIERLKNAYETPKDIDLFAGMSMETPKKGALVGDTFGCLIGDAFARLKFGDRFFSMNSKIKQGHSKRNN